MRRSELAVGLILAIYVGLCLLMVAVLPAMLSGCASPQATQPAPSVDRATVSDKTSSELCFVLLSAACSRSQECGFQSFATCMRPSPACVHVRGIEPEEADVCFQAIIASPCDAREAPLLCQDIGYIDAPQPQVLRP